MHWFLGECIPAAASEEPRLSSSNAIRRFARLGGFVWIAVVPVLLLSKTLPPNTSTPWAVIEIVVSVVGAVLLMVAMLSMAALSLVLASYARWLQFDALGQSLRCAALCGIGATALAFLQCFFALVNRQPVGIDGVTCSALLALATFATIVITAGFLAWNSGTIVLIHYQILDRQKRLEDEVRHRN
ncbi:MAG: hypothetical protein O2800_03335 [Planctomycetota bacterium]|nr:hypothetical protein [Planctomycetota bacterium]